MHPRLMLAVAISALPLAGVAAQSRFSTPPQQPVYQNPPVYQDQQAQMRYADMDWNGDGVITRGEWRGTAQAFSNADWNGDGILSGDEVRMTTTTQRRRVANGQQQRAQRFNAMDANRDGYVVRNEWQGTEEEFQALDQDYDYVLSRMEIVNPDRAARQNASRDSYSPYANDAYGTTSRYPVATSGQLVTIDPKARWTDTGISVTPGDRIVFQSEGSMQLSNSPAGVDVSSPAGASRKANDAPLRQQAAGAVIGRIGNGAPFLVGASRTMSASGSGQLYLGVNDDFLDDNTGQYRVNITIERR